MSRFDDSLPSLADLLAPTCFAEIARRINRPRGFVWRLRHGQILRDDSLVAPLARALHRDETFIRRVCANDYLRHSEAQAS